MASTSFGGAESGEVLVTAERIDEGDIESRHAEWRRTARTLPVSMDPGLGTGQAEPPAIVLAYAANYSVGVSASKRRS